MATWTTFYVKHPNKEALVEKIKTLSGIPVSTEGPFPKDHHDSFLMDGADPNYLLVGSTQPGWITVVHNSGVKLEDWCSSISRDLETELILIMAQTVSDYYYFAYYSHGEKLRELEFCYSDDMDSTDLGKKFDFEDEQPGIKHNFSGEVEYLFDLDAIEKYCNHFGLTIQFDMDQTNWTILKHPEAGNTMEAFIGRYKKPWWKFW